MGSKRRAAFVERYDGQPFGAMERNNTTPPRRTTSILLALGISSTVGCSNEKKTTGDETKQPAKVTKAAEAPEAVEAAEAPEAVKEASEKKAEPEIPSKYKRFPDGRAPVELSGWEVEVETRPLAPNEGSKHLLLFHKTKFKVTSRGKIVDGFIKTTCKVGGRYYTDIVRDASIVEPGTFDDLEIAPFGWTGLPGDPERCQVTALYYQHETAEYFLLGRFCFDGKSVAEGTCKGFPPPAPADAATKVDVLEIEPIPVADTDPSKGPKALAIIFAIAPGKTSVGPVPEIQVEASCRVGAKKMEDERSVDLPLLEHAAPGEALLLDTRLFRGDEALTSAPKSCALSFELRPEPRAQGRPLGTFCFKDGKVSEGAC